MKNFFLLVALSAIWCSCEKTVSFQLEATPPVMVVDATIENGQVPMVVLSKSLNYFSKISPEILLNSFVHGAEITLSTGSQSQQLKEYSYSLGGNARFYYYSSDTTSGAFIFRGEFKKSYSMEIKADGQLYTTSTTIPPLTKTLDSLWWKKAPYTKDTTKVVLMARVNDPPGLGNYIRYFTKTGSGPFLPGMNSVYDDQIIDGTVYDIEVEKGVDRNSPIDPNNYSFFHRGDTVTGKFCNIDKATFDFWRTMEYSYSSIGNPFSSPTRVQGNIKGGALGYFGGYAVQYKSFIIPK
jgi:hypothetical protein